VNTLANTNAGTPQANCFSTVAVRSASSLVKAPRVTVASTMKNGATSSATGCRQGESHSQRDAIVERLATPVVIARYKAPRQPGHQRQPDRNAHQAQGKLVQPIRVIQYGAGAGIGTGQHLADQGVICKRRPGSTAPGLASVRARRPRP
jgi:hypothetical protein